MCVNGIELDEFTRAYLECALWAETDNADDSGGEPLDRNYSIDDFDPASLTEAAKWCADFLGMEWEGKTVQAWLDSIDRPASKRGYDGETYSAAASDGHDFWLTRGGHGAGFWDRGYDDVGEIVTRACKTFGEAYVEPDGNGGLTYRE